MVDNRFIMKSEPAGSRGKRYTCIDTVTGATAGKRFSWREYSACYLIERFDGAWVVAGWSGNAELARKAAAKLRLREYKIATMEQPA